MLQRLSALDLFFVLVAIEVPFHLLRLLAVFDTAPVFVVLELGLMLIVPILAWINGAKIFPLNAKAYVVLVMIGLSALIGIAAGNPMSRVILDSLRPFSFFLCYWMVRNAPDTWIRHQALSKTASFLFVVSGCTAVALSRAAEAIGYEFYLSITEVFFILPLALFFIRKQYLLATANFGLLLMGGRRGALLGFLVALVPFVVRRQSRTFVVLGATVAFVGAVLIAGYPPVQDAFLNLGTISKTMDIYHVAAQRSGDGDWEEVADRMFDDRIREVRAITLEMDRNWINSVFGMGAGHSYMVDSKYNTVGWPETRGVHFSPVGVYAYYGFLGLLIVGVFYWQLLVRAIRQYRDGKADDLLAYAFLIVGFIFNTLTAFAVFISPCFAICAGLLVREQMRNDARGR